MMDEEVRAFTVVESLMGRDKGHLFLVVGHEAGRLLLADGRLHPMERPKKKNVRHVRKIVALTDRMRRWVESGHQPQDHELRRELESMIAERPKGGAEDVQGGDDRG